MPGEHEQGADWGDPSAGEQTGNRDGLGPDEEDATAEPLKLFPGFPRSVVYKIGDFLGTATTGQRLCVTEGATVAYFLMRAENRAQTLDVRAEDQQGPGPDGSATASGQASRSETKRGRSATTEVAVSGPAGDAGRASTCRIPEFPPYD